MSDEAVAEPQIVVETSVVTFDEIRERAYDIWERNHRPEGFEVAFWIMAERELKSGLAASQTSGRLSCVAHLSRNS